MIKDLIQLNQLLIDYFGIPSRKKRKPNPLEILICTILSQNTNDKNSYRAYKNLKSRVKSWDDILSLRVTELAKVIKVAGLGNQKASSIKSIIKSLKDKTGKVSLNHLLKFDNDVIIEELTKFKGVGVKTASCVLLFSMHRNTCPVDTHVHRILNRVGIVKTNSPDKTYLEINEHIPENAGHSIHTNLLRLGREICLPTNPRCFICPIEKHCKFPKKNLSPTPKKSENKFFLLDKI